nr:MAG TPA: Large subunit terminase [Caudoviricetes sp.]
MAKQMKVKTGGGSVTIDLGRPNSEPQREFFASRCKYTAYGGARGGGKTWASSRKAIGGALRWPGIKILMIRREYDDMRNSLIEPMLAILPQEIATYNGTLNIIYFVNGSTIKFGNMPGYGAAVAGKYQGQEYDWIFMEEATQFIEQEFRGLGACLRGVNKIPKRFYLTCNPGGVGHHWVKRLFVSREFRDGENPADYCFIKATVEDNKDLMESSPDYVQALDLLPEDIRNAHRYGDWDALAGTYFSEFRPELHTCKPFRIPDEWPRYRAFDYGLDMFACLWIAVDFSGRCYVYREYCESDLVVSDAARVMRACTPPEERVSFTIAPPDMWNRQKDSGKNMAELFMQNGIGLLKASNSRIQGWLALKELMKLRKDGKPGLIIFSDCKSLIEFLPALQHDTKNPSDCAKEPHEITHAPDALRYFAVMRTMPAIKNAVITTEDDFDDGRGASDYDSVMCGGEPQESYMFF